MNWRGWTLAYALVLAVLLSAHEPWRDEWQAFMIGRDSHSLTELWNHRYYDAHPPLWHFLLFLVSKLNRSVVCLKALHWLLATAAAAVFLAFSPWPRRYQVALLGGYYLLYEYAVISRNYSLGLLWLWLACALWTRRPGDYRSMAWIYLAMALTNVHIFLLGSALWLVLGLEFLIRPERRAQTSPAVLAQSLVLLLVAVALFLKVTYLPPDTGYPKGFDLSFNLPRLLRALTGPLLAFAPIPPPGIQFHDTSYFHESDLRITGLLGALLWLAGGACLTTPLARGFYLSGSATMLFFTYAKFVGFHRHAGHFYLVWLACLWLDRRPRFMPWVATIASLHLALAARAAWLDFSYDFTPAGRVAGFLRDHNLQDRPIVGLPDGVASAVAGNLDRPFYYPDCRRWGTFLIWDNRRELQAFPPPDLLAQLAEVARQRGSPVVVVAGLRLWRTRGSGWVYLAQLPGVRLRELATFPAGIVTSEIYWLYEIDFEAAKDAPHASQPNQSVPALDGGVSPPKPGHAAPPGPTGPASGNPGPAR